MDLNNKQLAYALTVLRTNEQFAKVKAAIQAQLESELYALPEFLDDAQIRQAQGRCQALQALLHDFEAGVEAYETMQKG